MTWPAHHAGERSRIGVEVQQERDDGTVVSKHSLQSGLGRAALSMSDIEAKPMSGRAGVRAAALFGAALPATTLQQVRCLIGLRHLRQLVIQEWIPKLVCRSLHSFQTMITNAHSVDVTGLSSVWSHADTQPKATSKPAG